MINLTIIFIVIIANLITSFDFSPTWDFPQHVLAGLVRLGEVSPPAGYRFIPYGIFADIIPLLFSRIFPSGWFPASYLLFAVTIGCIGIVFFYLFVKQSFGAKIALLTTITIFLLPRFLGHLHTNIKDMVTTSFFIISMYYFHQYLQKEKMIMLFASLSFFAFAVNTKLSALQMIPVIIAWAFFRFQILNPDKKLNRKPLSFYFLLLLTFISLPLFFWFLLWPESLSTFYPTMVGLNSAVSAVSSRTPLYAFEQFFATTPLPILVFLPFGLFALYKKAKEEKSHASFFFLTLFLYTLLKYPLLRQPIIDDVRYFLDIYYPLSLAFALGVFFLFKNKAIWVFLPIFIYLTVLVVIYHPYQISYRNVLAQRYDPDFWAASFTEVFQYINNTAEHEVTISARLAPELAYYLLRPDLRINFNSQPPEKSEVVVVLNRPSAFEIFQVKDFVESHTPQKTFTNRMGEPLTYIYYP